MQWDCACARKLIWVGLVCRRPLKALDPGTQAKTMGNKFGRRKSAETSRPETDEDDKGHVSDHGSASVAEQARPREVVSPPGNLTCKRLLSTVHKAQNLAPNVAFL